MRSSRALQFSTFRSSPPRCLRHLRDLDATARSHRLGARVEGHQVDDFSEPPLVATGRSGGQGDVGEIHTELVATSHLQGLFGRPRLGLQGGEGLVVREEGRQEAVHVGRRLTTRALDVPTKKTSTRRLSFNWRAAAWLRHPRSARRARSHPHHLRFGPSRSQLRGVGLPRSCCRRPSCRPTPREDL